MINKFECNNLKFELDDYSQDVLLTPNYRIEDEILIVNLKFKFKDKVSPSIL